jgi:hypothetical protein
LREIVHSAGELLRVRASGVMKRHEEVVDQPPDAPVITKLREITQPRVKEIHDDSVCDGPQAADIPETGYPIGRHRHEQTNVIT